MKNIFITQSEIGKNHWWRYVLTILAVVAAVALANIGIQQVLPAYKSLFPETQFGKDLGTTILVGVVFGLAVLAFTFASKKLHNRPAFSYLSVDGRFNWSQYFGGFLIWAVLIFVSGLITDYDQFQTFLGALNVTHLVILFAVSFISIGVQSFTEEFILRGYFLQGLHLRIKNLVVLVAVNALIFGLLHFGYGIESFIHSFTFGIAFALLVIFQNRIEFASGAHNANNLVLSLFFLDLTDATNAEFSWSIDPVQMVIHFTSLGLLVGVAYKFFRK